MTGTIAGTVIDGNGDPIEGADVQAIGTGITTASATTDANGDYSMSGLQADTYNVTARKIVYSDNESSVEVQNGGTTTADFQLSGLKPKVVGAYDDTVGVGIYGESQAGSGSPIALYGGVDADDGYGLYADGDAEVVGTLSAQQVNVSRVGLSAYRGSNQSISSGSRETVAFDAVYVSSDHFDVLNTSTGIYTIPSDGVYHVDFQITWADQFSEGDTITYELDTGGGRGLVAEKTVATGHAPTHSFSKTIYAINQGTALEVMVEQDTGSTMDVLGAGNKETFITIDKVG